MKLKEEDRVEYLNCVFSAGFRIGKSKRIPDEDMIFLLLDKDGKKTITIFMRPDEAQAVIKILSRTIQKYLVDEYRKRGK